ncbi:hypothetical protein DV495_000472 [Geotrichum candidum]|nr:hypothetical protein DV495_000472 [Geotrichum candidum]
MVNFNSSEKVTKFINGKDTKPEDLLPVAKALSDGDLDIYFPQKNVFLLNWVLTYLGNNKRTHARIDVEFWRLLRTVWASLSDDEETISRLYLNKNFLGTLSKTLEELSVVTTKDFDEDKLDKLLTGLAEAIQMVGTANLWFKCPSDIANGLLLGLFKLIHHTYINFSSVAASSSLILLTNQIFNVLQATLFGAGDLQKLSATFNTKALPVAFVVLGYKLPEPVFDHIKSSIEVLLFDKADSKSDPFVNVAPTNDTIKKAIQADTAAIDNSAVQFFSIVSQKFPSKGANAFTELSNFYPNSTKLLLKAASERQIKIETESLAKLVDTILKGSVIQWEFLESILDLDATVVIQDTRLAKLLSTKSKATPEFVSFAKAIIKYFSEARELVQFILSWKSHISDNSPWCDDDVLDFISFHVNSLSTHQLKGLLKQLIEPVESGKTKQSAAQLFLPIVTVVMSFFRHHTPPSETLYDVLTTVLTSKTLSESEFLWRTKYLILSLNPDMVKNSYEKILKQIKKVKFSSKTDDGVCFYTMQILFRIREFVEIKDFDDTVQDIIKYIGKKTKSPEKYLTAITNRWLLVVSHCFNDENRLNLISIYTKYEDEFQALCLNEVFYEQRKLARNVITQIASELTEKNEVTLYRSKFLSFMPMEIVKRENRAAIMNTLINVPFDKKDLELHTYIRTAVNRFLNNPSLTTDIETNPDVLRDYFTAIAKVNDEKLYAETRSGCEKLISYHASSQNQEGSVKFIEKLIAHETKFLKGLKTNKLLSASKLSALDFSCLVAITSPAETIVSTGLSDILINVLLEQLEKTKSSISESWEQSISILRNLDKIWAITKKLSQSSNLHFILGGYVSYAIKSLQKDQSDSKAQELLTYSFQILTRSSDELIEIETVISLYVLVCQFGVSIDEDLLVHKLSGLDDSEFNGLLSQIVEETFNGLVGPFAYYEVAKTFAMAADSKTHPSTVEHIIRLISLTIKHSKSLDAKSLLAFNNLVNMLLKEKSAIITQYCLELIIAAETGIALEGPELESGSNQDDAYISIVKVVSTILLQYRHRLNGRYFLFTRVFTTLLMALAIPRHGLASTRFARVPADASLSCEQLLSDKAAVAYSRVLGYFCDPPVHAMRERAGKNNLTSITSITRRQVAKFVGVLLINYIRFTLQAGFVGAIKKALTPGFYLVFDVLDEDKQKNANLLLDANSRPYFKTLYEDYMAHGKWKNDE